MRCNKFAYVFVATILCACWRDTDRSSTLTPPLPVTIRAIQALSRDPLGAVVAHDAAGTDLIRVRYTLSDLSDSGFTPWQSADSSIVVLGLGAGGDYTLNVQSSFDGRTIDGPASQYQTPPLPASLDQVTIGLQGTFTGGYSMSPIAGLDGHGYLIIFDSLGTIRWYRDFGPQVVFATTQQEDGHITAFVGASTGFNMMSGVYVEVTPAGDSVRSISAIGSVYTDPHELLESFDSRGNRRADYLFGYRFEAFDRTEEGGGPSDSLAVHQVLRINATGQVDTLISGDEHWSLADDVEPPLIADLDHPNSIDFDLDGGVIVSYRDLSAIVKVDPTTNQIIWQLGGTHNQFTFVDDPLGGFDGQHTARILPNGHLLIFDNGWTHSPQASRAVEYALDPVRMTATMVWQYSANPSIFNDFTGSAQRLENGNTVVAFTRMGIVDEVRADGTLLSRATLESAPGRIATPYRVTRIKSLYGYARP
jgi:Arylsulfotransferase (ASST)